MSVTAAAAALPYRIPTPVADPPYDDERDTPDHPTSTWQMRQLLAPLPFPREAPKGRSALGPASSGLPENASPAAARGGPRPDQDPGQWAARFARGIAEALVGERAVRQMAESVSVETYETLQRYVYGRPLTPHRMPARRTRIAIRSVHWCEPSIGVVEASVNVRVAEHHLALALRMQGQDGRWVCTALVVGQSRGLRMFLYWARQAAEP